MVILCPPPYPKEKDVLYGGHFSIFPYQLSDFQKYSIEAIVTGNHVLVTAHTSNGKTTPAEFAIQYFTSQGKRVIYTCPIKSLSNQKFYDFSKKYPEISFGIFTGDIKYNPSAQVLFMTAEILLNTLLHCGKKSRVLTTPGLDFEIDIHQELYCVVMDEVHFILDKERGFVWEQTLMILPSHIQVVMLSATIDNPHKLASWYESIGSAGKSVYLASTTKRIVPLIHYGYMITSELLYKKMKDKAMEQMVRKHTNQLIEIKSQTGEFREECLLSFAKTKQLLRKHNIIIKPPFVLNSLSKYMVQHQLLPAIVYVFSKKKVEEYASMITTNLFDQEDDPMTARSYTIKRDVEHILRKLPNYREYMELPEYPRLIALLEKGIGIHHAGMISVFREIVEFLIVENKLKLIFSTETIAIGINAPIRTTVYTSLIKFDGNLERYLYSQEYNQGAGRAGRRGIDTVGNVIHCNNLFELPDRVDYKKILCGHPQKLESTYQMTPMNFLCMCKYLEDDSGKNCNVELIELLKKSMYYVDIKESIGGWKKERTQTIAEIGALNMTDFLHGDVSILRYYRDFKECIRMSINKKRKAKEKEMQEYLEMYPFLSEWSDGEIGNYLEKIDKIQELEKTISYYEQVIEHSVKHMVDTLITQKYLGGCGEAAAADKNPRAEASGNDELEAIDEVVGAIAKATNLCPETKSIDMGSEQWTLQKKGTIAIQIKEIDGIEFTEFLLKTNYFENFSKYEIAEHLLYALHRREAGMDKDTSPLFSVKQLHLWMDYVHQCEAATAPDIDSQAGMDMQQDSKDGDGHTLNTGDFVKLILSINEIIRELLIIADREEKYDLYKKLKEIEKDITKGVCTSVSLYV